MEKIPSRWWDLPSAILLFFLVLFSAWRLQVTDWTEGLHIVRNLAILGLGLGMALGQSYFQKRGVTFFTLAYMLVFFTWQWLGFIQNTSKEFYLNEQLLILFSRITTNFQELFAGRAIEDQFLVLVLLSFPFWFASTYSGYQLTRHANILTSVLPSAILMFLLHYYHYTSKDYSWFFGVYLFVALLFLGRQKYIKDKIKWAQTRVLFSRESSIDINNTSMTVAATLILLVWFIPYTLPSTASTRELWQNISGNWFSSDYWDNLFSSLNTEKKPQARNFQTEMGLGNQTSQSDLIVFLAYAPPSAEEYPRLYWRGQVYDTFADNRWFITQASEKSQPASNSLKIPDTQNRERLTFTFDIFTETQIILFSASQPISVGRNTLVLYNQASPTAETIDVMTLRASPALKAGDVIRVSAMLGNPTIPELQNASQFYPDWVKEKYLQLPDDFSPRIRDLALAITAEAPTSFDKATAITNYLRTEINYYPAIDVPDDVDPLEYFLFKKKQGFCNYYASAEVLMLRSIGIPARLAIGYAQGEANVQESIYTVRERDLHAWPEVYFPEYGWVEFEPTGNQNPLTRPIERIEENANAPITLNPARRTPLEDEESASPENEAEEKSARGVFLSVSQIRWLSFLGGFSIFGVVIFFIKRKYAPKQSVAWILKTTLEKNKWKVPAWLKQFLIWATLPAIERYFEVINTSSRWLKVLQPIHATAIERANLLCKALPNAEEAITILLREHQFELFSRQGGNALLARRAAWEILVQTLRALVF